MSVSISHARGFRVGLSLPWALSAILAILLACSLVSGLRTRAELEGQAAEAAAQAHTTAGYWRARAGACEAQLTRIAEAAPAQAAPAQAVTSGPAPAAGASRDRLAARLVAQPPAGIDGCARMESADQAVLSTLK